jgi:hypothetical protein
MFFASKIGGAFPNPLRSISVITPPRRNFDGGGRTGVTRYIWRAERADAGPPPRE